MASPLNPPRRILLGPGPSNPHPRVLEALSAPVVGHLDPEFFKVMEESKAMLRWLFHTENELTFPVSGTGSAGMETCLVNLIEEGDTVLVCVNGVFGTRMADIVERLGGNLVKVEAPWGEIIRPEQVEQALKDHKIDIVTLVHAETSTGVLQPVEEISRLAHDAGALLVLDTVTSLGGCPVTLDAWNVDATYSGTQKCLSCPPGLSPVSFNQAARDKLGRRKGKVKSWYLDLTMIERYWGEDRAYHHTAPISMNYGLHAALSEVEREGLEARFRAPRVESSGAWWPAWRFWASRWRRRRAIACGCSTASRFPEGVNDAALRKRLLLDFNIEIGGGLGALAGKTWRIGLMGESSRRENVVALVQALGQILKEEGADVPVEDAVGAIEGVYAKP